jgi:hypothetical protein
MPDDFVILPMTPRFHDNPFGVGSLLNRAIAAATKPDGSIADLDAVEHAFAAIAAGSPRNDIFKLLIIEALRVRIVAKLKSSGLADQAEAGQ